MYICRIMKYRKLTELHKLENNPRTIKDASFKSLCKSIQDNPDYFEARPVILSDRTGQLVIIAGNQRYDAAKHLKLKEIPTHLLQGLTEEREQEIIIRDNVANGEWDMNLLADWDRVKLGEWGVICDWPVEQPEVKDDDFEIPETIETDIVLGDLFEIGEHRLLCGDSTQTDTFEKLMKGELADMCVTDPPYNVEYEGKTKDALTIKNDSMSNDSFYQFLYDFYTALTTAVKKGGSIYVWHASSEVINFGKAMVDAGWLLKQQLIWVKNTMVMGRQDYQWKHEPCLYGWLDGAAHNWYSDRKQTTVIEYDRPQRSAEHPTMKPVGLFTIQINNSSKQGDIVIDPFGGSGTTMVCCEQIKRKARIIEFDPKYCQVIIDRMRKLDPTLTIKRNGEVM